MDRWPVNRCQVYGRRKEDDFEGKLFKHNIANLFYQAAQVQTAAGFQVREDHNRKPFLRQDDKITGKAGLHAAVPHGTRICEKLFGRLISIINAQPLAAVNHFSTTCQYNLIVIAPFNRYDAAWRVHINDSIRLSVNYGSDDRGTRTSARAFSFADAPFPDALFNVCPVAHPNEDDVCPLRKLSMIFDQRPEPPPIKFIEIVNEDAAIGVSHLQRRNLKRLPANHERKTYHPLERLVSRHRNRC